MDGDTSATGTTLVDADRLVVNDNGTMVQVAISDVKTYLNSAGYVTDDPTALAIALGWVKLIIKGENTNGKYI